MISEKDSEEFTVSTDVYLGRGMPQHISRNPVHSAMNQMNKDIVHAEENGEAGEEDKNS